MAKIPKSPFGLLREPPLHHHLPSMCFVAEPNLLMDATRNRGTLTKWSQRASTESEHSINIRPKAAANSGKTQTWQVSRPTFHGSLLVDWPGEDRGRLPLSLMPIIVFLPLNASGPSHRKRMSGHQANLPANVRFLLVQNATLHHHFFARRMKHTSPAVPGVLTAHLGWAPSQCPSRGNPFQRGQAVRRGRRRERERVVH